MNVDINRLNVMNYYVESRYGSHWYAISGLRSLFNLSKISDTPFKTICETLHTKGQVEIKDLRNEYRGYLLITMI